MPFWRARDYQMTDYIVMEMSAEDLEDFYSDYNESYPIDEGEGPVQFNTSAGKGGVCDLSESMHFEAVYIPLLYSLTMVVGLLGNGLLLAILFFKRRSWSVTDTFILHLGVADCLLLVTLPFWAAQAAQDQGWSFGTPLCKITGALFTINFYCGIFLLACISLDRYLSIVHATQMFSHKKSWVVQTSCLTVWLFSLLLSVPDWVFLQAVVDPRRKRAECIHNYMAYKLTISEWRLISRLLYHILGFLLPSVVLVFCYSCILFRLQRGSRGAQKKRAIRVILALVIVFFLCWTPYNIALLVDTVHAENGTLSEGCQTRTSLDIALIITSSFGYLHCSLNPVLYAFVGVKFRRQLVDVLRFLGCKLKSGTGFHSSGSRRSSIWSESGETSHSIAF